MCSRHSELNGAGADSAQGLADAIAIVEATGLSVGASPPHVYAHWHADARFDEGCEGCQAEVLANRTCIACSEPALPDSIYCKGHDRIGEYRVTDKTHWAANE